MDQLQTFIDKIKVAKKIVFFGGAGVSTNSGIPDFRSADGLFVKGHDYHYAPEQIVSGPFFHRYPQIFFEFYFKHLVYPQAKPCSAHLFAVWLEKYLNKEVTVITQNIDGLHQKAGSSRVLELHGSVLRNYCTQCGRFYPLEDLKRDKTGVPRCVDDHAIVKPDVVLYQEGLDSNIIDLAINSLREADLLLIVGTSLVVYPAAGMIDYFQGQDIVVINREKLEIYRSNLIQIESEMGQFFSQVMELYRT